MVPKVIEVPALRPEPGYSGEDDIQGGYPEGERDEPRGYPHVHLLHRLLGGELFIRVNALNVLQDIKMK